MKIQRPKQKTKRFPRYILLIPILLIVFVISVLLYRIFSVNEPQIEGADSFRNLPAKKEIYFMVESNFPVKSISVVIRQDGKETVLLDDKPELNHKDYNLILEPKKLGLKDGTCEVEIVAQAGLLKKTNIIVNGKIDTVPPILAILSETYITSQGSAAAVLASAKDAVSVHVEVDKKQYRATKGVDGNKNNYFAIYPIARHLPLKSPIYVAAVDEVGNKAKTAVKTIITKTRYKKDTIRISDNFIKKKIYPILGKAEDDPDMLESFIEVNKTWRERDNDQIKKAAGESADKILWQGRFLQMKKSKVFSTFGDMRDYVYKGKTVSKSVHLGYDLASLSHSPIEASNSGTVIFTGPVGIYGNTMIIDHGLGLMTLYAHLSSIEVDVGQAVKKGEIVARSGQTGLAVGDHLHFAILCHGVYVSPVPWWDISWIEKRVMKVLNGK